MLRTSLPSFNEHFTRVVPQKVKKVSGALERSVQRIAAIRIAKGYRTISFEAATLIARFPPLDILADMDSRIYQRLHQDEGSDPLTATQARKKERELFVGRWHQKLLEPQTAQQRAVQGILPNFHTWLKRRDRVTFRLTQVLRGTAVSTLSFTI